MAARYMSEGEWYAVKDDETPAEAMANRRIEKLEQQVKDLKSIVLYILENRNNTNAPDDVREAYRRLGKLDE